MIDQKTIFWLHILYPVLSCEVSNARQYFIEQASRPHKLLDGTTKRISLSACERKLAKYKEDGVAGIQRPTRKDAGKYRKVPANIHDMIGDIYRANPHMQYVEISREIKDKHKIDIRRSTFYSLIRDSVSKGYIPDKEKAVVSDIKDTQAKLLRMIIDGYTYEQIYQGISHSPRRRPIDVTAHDHDKSIVSIETEWKSSTVLQKKHICIVMLHYLNYSTSEIQRIIGCSDSTVKRRVKQFKESGEVGRERRKENTSYTMKKTRLIELLHIPPSQHGINRTTWTALTLKRVYKELYGKELGTSTICRIIKNSTYSLRKARRVLTSPDPKYREKVDLLIKTLHSLNEREELFFIDEVGPYRIKKYGGRSYVEKGHKKTFPQNQPDKGSVTFSAALSAQKNQMTWHFHRSKDTKAMIYLIELIFNQYHHLDSIYLSWDAASWHSSNELTEWLDQMNLITRQSNNGPIIFLIPLPSNAQFLDVIESVFSGMKKAVIDNSDYQSMDEMKRAISRHFAERNEFFAENPKRVGKKIWEIAFFQDYDNLKSGNYREY